MRKRKFVSAVSIFLVLLTTAVLAFAAVPPAGRNYAECTTPGGTLTTKVNLAFQEQKPDTPDNPEDLEDPEDPSYSVGGDTSYAIAKDAVYTVEHYKQTAKSSYTLADSERFDSKENASVTAKAKTYDGYTENLTHPNRVPSGSVKADSSLVLKLYYDRNVNHSGTSSSGSSSSSSHGGSGGGNSGGNGSGNGSGGSSISGGGNGGSGSGSANEALGLVLNKKDHMKYINGYPDGTVRPMNNITRGEVAQIIYRLMLPGFRDSHYCDTNSFGDVDENVWCNVPISTLADAKLINGYSDGTFGYNRSITRAEFVAIISRFFAVSGGGECPFADIADHWARTDIEKIASLGYVKGRTGTTFEPDAPITRAEAAAILNRILERGTAAEFMLENMKVWPDNLAGAWYYEDIQEASNGHDYKGEDGHEVWTVLAQD